jgi:DNA-binding transcriptional MerR regulator
MNYTVKAAARATGISESRLRTWERRYGIPRPGRAPSGRRLYDDNDLSLIRRMAALLDAGMSAAEAAEAALSAGAAPTAAARPEHELVSVIARGAETYDEALIVGAIGTAAADLGWADALDQVLFPALRRVGVYWQTAVFAPATEHFASELVRRELLAAISPLPPAPAGARRVLLACPEEERHDLGLTALSLVLRQASLRTLYLGADVPTADILEVCEVTRPDAICLSATSSIGLASLIRASRLIVAERRAPLFLGGPSVTPSLAEAAGIHLPASIQAAAAVIIDRLSR